MTLWKTSLAGLAGAAVALSVATAWDVARHVLLAPPPARAASDQPLQPSSVDPSWVLAGQPNFRSVETARAADGRSVTGLWACDGPSTFEWTFATDEAVHLLEGQIEVSYLGRRFVINPGQTAKFYAGTKAVWHVPSHAKKVFTLTHTGRMVLWWRQWFPPESVPVDGAPSVGVARGGT